MRNNKTDFSFKLSLSFSCNYIYSATVLEYHHSPEWTVSYFICLCCVISNTSGHFNDQEVFAFCHFVLQFFEIIFSFVSFRAEVRSSSLSADVHLVWFWFCSKVSRSKCFHDTTDEHWTWLLLITRTCRNDEAVEVLVQTSWYDLYLFIIRYDSDPVLQFWSLTVGTDVESLPVWTNIWILDINWSLRRRPHDTWTGVRVFVSWPTSTEPLMLPPWVQSQRVSSWTEPLTSQSTRLQSSSSSFYSDPNVL